MKRFTRVEGTGGGKKQFHVEISNICAFPRIVLYSKRRE